MKRSLILFLAFTAVSFFALRQIGGQTSSISTISFDGTSTLPADDGSVVSTETGSEVMTGPETNQSFQKFITGSVSPARVPSSQVPTPPGVTPVPGSVSAGFLGIRHRDQRLAGTRIFSHTPVRLDPTAQRN